MVRIRFQPTIWINGRLEISGIFGLVSSANASKQAKNLAPSAARCRRMLGELHKHFQLPAESFAGLLGLPKITMRKWLNGERQLSAAAKRLVWVLHCAVFDPSVLGKLDGWLNWSGSIKKALEGVADLTGTADSGAAGTPPAKEVSRNGPNVQTRKLRSVVKRGELMEGDLHHIGIVMLVAAVDSIRRSLDECDESIGRCDLDLETKLKVLDLKSVFVAQQMSLAETLLDWKRGRFPPTDDNPRRQPSFAPRERVYPATSHEEAAVHVGTRADNTAF